MRNILLGLAFLLFSSLAHTSSDHKENGQASSQQETQPAKKLTIAFASQNSDIPESAFGHVFLVFYTQEKPEPDAETVEFVGTVTGFTDMVKTLVNNVEGKYKITSFEQKLWDYDLEDRDIFLLRIKASPEEIDRLNRRIKALTGSTYPYNFTQLNCAYYLLDILALEGIASSKHLTSLAIKPTDLLKSLPDSRLEGVSIIPSSQTTFRHYAKKLDPKDIESIKKIPKGYDLDPQAIANNQDIRQATSAYIKNQITRETDHWKRQNLARNQIAAWHADPDLEHLSYQHDTDGHASLSADGKGTIFFGYQPERKNFYTQRTAAGSTSYFDTTGIEIAIHEGHLSVSKAYLLKSESIQTDTEKSRLLEIGYSDRIPFEKNGKKEYLARAGMGWAIGKGAFSTAMTPYSGLGYANGARDVVFARLGLKFVAEYDSGPYGLRFSADHWWPSPFNHSSEKLIQLRRTVVGRLTLGLETGSLNTPRSRLSRIILNYSF